MLIGIKIPSLMKHFEVTAKALVDKGIIQLQNCEDEKSYIITDEGRIYADYIHENDYLTKCFYDEFYKASEVSKAHGKFCTLAYGKNLCQHGMADMNQINRLIELMDLNKDSEALELGCGSGHITEYISEVTKVQIKGIDLSPAAIELAVQRTKDKENNLKFEANNVYSLSYKENSFDAIIAIDVLNFINPFGNVMENLAHMLKPKGKMYIFYMYPPEATEIRLDSELKRLKLNYYTIDLCKENYAHWKLKEKTLSQLKSEFEEEGSMFLYENRSTECSGNLCDHKRYLYVVNKN
jgi:ubiquinone/menaquinone biosynthesis C-methylase UbiE